MLAVNGKSSSSNPRIPSAAAVICIFKLCKRTIALAIKYRFHDNVDLLIISVGSLRKVGFTLQRTASIGQLLEDGTKLLETPHDAWDLALRLSLLAS